MVSMIIGYAYVVADIFHIGHLQHLLNCKALCDKLLVGVLTDEATMEKKVEPIVPFEERVRIVSALKCVDVVVSQNTYSPIANLKAIKPDIFFESTSHSDEAVSQHTDIMKSIDGKIISLPYYPTQSSSHIKQKILDEWKGAKHE